MGRNHRQQGLLIFILLTAAVLRLSGLHNSSPPGIEHDEVANWLIDRSILAGNHAIYFTQAYGHEAGFHYLQTAFVALLGDNVLALRLPAAFAGLLLVAVTYALARRLFGRQEALLTAALIAILFWPVFYSRLGLRAITLPLLSGLSAYFWWGAWDGATRRLWSSSSLVLFAVSGFCAGLSFHTYMAARAVPIFYGLFTLYLAVVDWPALRARWRGVALFWLVYALGAAPLVIYLLTNPGAEYRISEVDAPLRALLAGDWQPVLHNAIQILVGFGVNGDPLWRQNVAGRPVFDPIGALLFYVGVLYMLWRWRTPKYGFVLLWLAAATIPSLVTVDAPSNIRMIQMLPVLSIPISRVIHKIGQFSTKRWRLSTRVGYVCLGLSFTAYMWGTAVALFHTWPNNDEVQFVWQAALTDMGVYLDENETMTTAAIAGWSPETMDVPTMSLLLRRDDLSLSHFSPLDGTLLLSLAVDGRHHLLRPTILEFDPLWAAWVQDHGGVARPFGAFVQHTLPQTPSLPPQYPADVFFGEQIRLLGYDVVGAGAEMTLLTYWRVEQRPSLPARLFVQILDADGALIAEDYHWDTADPQRLWFAHWQAGDLILQKHTLPGLDTAVHLRLGIFDPYTCDPGPCANLLTETGAGVLLVVLE